MHVPRDFAVHEVGPVVDLIQANPLACFVTTRDGVPVASHIPVVFASDDDLTGLTDLVGVTMYSHLDVMNPQYTALADGDRALVVFQGSHGYISPTVYDVVPAAPTWNFSAVHVRGRIRLLGPGEPALKVVKRTVTALEGRFGQGWDMTDSIPYFERIVPGVGAFEFEVEAVDSIFKLSQDQPAELRDKVESWFHGSGVGTHRALATEMCRHRPATQPTEEKAPPHAD
ncbi:FMN-binding negative transcriptional regulator [Streptomyces sp. RY43-2]|uniref:FMN-binding negative transcriptional regulator n=1 Tax=Streptomyces macrolidinus TaxID=2952607 RepID=A0ABT0ZMY8_9ACTN|nr:FMN-binding negative transcriptional regulator [Streptomyces macrolidinus]MCN9244954.1 FMN-binding negative transcriptional regulator [Streptomyces macrolidinus]